jgi:hypothetical protein
MARRLRLVVLTPKTLVLVWLCLTGGCGSDDAGATNTATGGAATGGAATGAAATGGTADTGGASTAGGAGGTISTSDCRVWMATDGDDANPGTEALPVLTLVKGYDLLCPAPPTGTENGAECLGEAPRTLCIKPGTYPMNLRFELRKTRMGTEPSPITLKGDPRSTTRPVLDFSTQPRVGSCGAPVDSSGGELTGITMNANYTVLKHLELTNANDNCVKVQGAHNLVEDVVVHGCADTGIQISSGSGYEASGTNNTVLNCDSYQNNDTQCGGNGGDGFAVKVGTGAGNVFRGCRAWDNANDGFSVFAWTSPVVLDNCWAINQASTTAGTNSDGDGFKLGGNSISTEHVLSNLVAVGNANGTSGYGFNEFTNPASMTCTGTCASWNNRTNVGLTISGVSTTAIGSATAAAMISAARNADGSLPAVSSL